MSWSSCSGPAFSGGRLVASQTTSSVFLPLRCVTVRWILANCLACGSPSCSASIERTVMARRSRRLRLLVSISRCVGGNALREEGLGGFLKALLVTFYRQQVIPSCALHDEPGCFHLGVEGVQHRHLPIQLPAGQQTLGHRDLIGLFIDRF